MRSVVLWTRFAVNAVLTATLLFVALRIVPGTTVAIQARMMLFVFVGPWVIAAFVVHPVQLLGAFSAVFLDWKRDGLTSARVLQLLGGLTIAAGAIGTFGSWFSFDHACTSTSSRLTWADVHGAMAASIMPPAFALIVRLTLFEPAVWSLRREFTPEDARKIGTAKIPARWKVAILVVVAVLLVEGFRVLVLSPAAEPEKPVHDTSIAAVGVHPASGKESPEPASRPANAGKPIRVEIVQSDSGAECRVDGKPLSARPGHVDEILEHLVRRKKELPGRRVEIEVDPAVPFKHLVAAMNACIRVTVARADDGAKIDFSDFRVRVPAEGSFAVVQRIHLVVMPPRRTDVVILQLPQSDLGEPVVEEGPEPITISVTYDADTGFGSIYVKRYCFTVDELKAWIFPIARSRFDGKTGISEIQVLIRCDKNAPVRTVFAILAVLAAEDLRVQNIWFEVLEPDR